MKNIVKIQEGFFLDYSKNQNKKRNLVKGFFFYVVS
jgi:hypothetical protein